MWDRQIPELTRRWRVIRFDLPGHGGAPAQPAATIGELTDRLLTTLDTLGVDRFAYVGCCVSGTIGTDLALRHPRRLLSLAVVGSAAHFTAAPRGGMRASDVRAGGLEPVARTAPERWFTPAFAGAQPAIVDWAVQMVRTTDLACYEAACEALAAFDVRAELGRIDLPALVIVGAEDQVTPAADVRVLVAGIRDAHLAVLPAARHLAPVEQPTAVTDLLTRHLATPPGQQGSQGSQGGEGGQGPQGPQVPQGMGARSGPGPTPASPQPAVVETPGANPYRTEGAAGAAGTSGSGNPYADGGRGEDRAAGAGRSGDGAPGEGDTPAGAGRALDSGNLYADAAPGAGRAAGSGAWDVARRGDDAPASASTPASASAPVPASGDDAPERAPVGGDPRVRGLRLRREVLGAGDALARHLDPGDFSADYEDLVTRVAWGDVWSRPGLDRRTRFLLTLTALTAGGHLDELATHTRAALRGGVSPDEIKETLLHASLYCGLPAAGKAFEVARRVVAEEADG